MNPHPAFQPAPAEPDYLDDLLPPGQTWFTPKEVAALVGRSDQYIRDCFDNQKILGHQFNGRGQRGQEKRRACQIHRRSLQLYLLETANHTPEDFMRRLSTLIRSCPQALREALSRELVA